MIKRLLPLALAVCLLLCWYLGFYRPLRREITQVRERTAQLQEQLADAAEAAASAARMELELARTELAPVAPYDNRSGVLSVLNLALAGTSDYTLSFSDPVFSEDGLVRRNVVLRLSCGTLAELTAMLDALDRSPWRCRVSAISLTGQDILTAPITVNATVTFYESTGLE